MTKISIRDKKTKAPVEVTAGVYEVSYESKGTALQVVQALHGSPRFDSCQIMIDGKVQRRAK